MYRLDIALKASNHFRIFWDVKGIDLDPSNPVLWNNRGYANSLKNNMNNAISDYKESLRLRPDNTDIRIIWHLLTTQ